MEIKILYFGQLCEITGCDSELLPVTSALPVADLIVSLEKKYPRIRKVAYSTALNRVLCDGSDMAEEDSELALMPPFAGG